MYLLIMEIDTFQVAGLPFPTVELVRGTISRMLTERERMFDGDEFEKLMHSMCVSLDTKRSWQHKKRGVEIQVSRYA